MTTVSDRPAAASGTFALGGDLPVHRLGFGAMQLTGAVHGIQPDAILVDMSTVSPDTSRMLAEAVARPAGAGADVRTPRPPHRMVLGLDGSDGSAHACHWCAALARSLDAEVVAVHAMEVPPYPLVTYEGLQPVPLDAEIILQWQEDRRRLVESEWCAPLRHAGVRHRALVVEGNPATVIMETAEAQRAGLIVVGRRGKGRLRRAAAGEREPAAHPARTPAGQRGAARRRHPGVMAATRPGSEAGRGHQTRPPGGQ